MAIQVDYLSNRLTVQGDPEDVAAARALLVSGAARPSDLIGFGAVLPLPRGLGFEEAALRTWGSWGDPLAAAFVEDVATRLSVTFDTAQGSPEPVAQALSRQVPGVSVRLDCVWAPDPEAVSATGRWFDGAGRLRRVEPGREHYLRVRPGTDEGELDELFPRGLAPSF